MSERLGYNPNQISFKEKDHVVKLIQREQRTWGLKDIPPPPDELFEVLNRANEKGYATLEPHYFPERKFTQDSKWPGLGIKPEDIFWQCIKNGELTKNSSQLYEMWFLIDTTPTNHEFPSSNPLGEVLKSLRNKGEIYVPSKEYYVGTLPLTSRSGISLDEIHKAVNPIIAEMFEIPTKSLRLPRFIERNIIGNLHNPEWNKTDDIYWQRWEWMEDVVSPYDDNIKRAKRALLCGGANHQPKNNSLSNFIFSFVNDKRMYYFFRPMITFPIEESDKIKAKQIQQQMLSPVFLRI